MKYNETISPRKIIIATLFGKPAADELAERLLPIDAIVNARLNSWL